MDSVGQRRMAALHGGRRDKLEVSPNLWAGVGLVRGGAGTALVGDPETVAARMKEYMRARHRHLHPVRLPAPGGGLPLRRAGVPAAAARAWQGSARRSTVNTGPFGETIANDVRPQAARKERARDRQTRRQRCAHEHAPPAELDDAARGAVARPGRW